MFLRVAVIWLFVIGFFSSNSVAENVGKEVLNLEQADAPKSDWIVLQNRISGEWLLYVEALLTDADGNGSERQLEAFRKSETEFKASGNDFGRMLACEELQQF